MSQNPISHKIRYARYLLVNELRVALEQPHGAATREPVLHPLDVAAAAAPSGAVQVVLQHLQEVAAPAGAQVCVAQPATRKN